MDGVCASTWLGFGQALLPGARPSRILLDGLA